MNQIEWLTGADPLKMLSYLRTVTDDTRAWRRKMRLLSVAVARQGYNQEMLNPVRLQELNAIIDQAEICADDDGAKLPSGEWIILENNCYKAVTWTIQDLARRNQKSNEDLANLIREIIADPYQPVFEMCKVLSSGKGNKVHHCHTHDKDVILFGNSWRCPDHWDCQRQNICTKTVVNLAKMAYQERTLLSGTGRHNGQLDPERLLILSDALEEAGCQNAKILEHLRGREFLPCATVWATMACPVCGQHNGETNKQPGREKEVVCLDCNISWTPRVESFVPGRLVNSLRPHVRGCWALDLILGLT